MDTDKFLKIAHKNLLFMENIPDNPLVTALMRLCNLAALDCPLLIVGPPGTGKSQIIKSLAEYTGWPDREIVYLDSCEENQAINFLRDYETGKQLRFLVVGNINDVSESLQTKLAAILKTDLSGKPKVVLVSDNNLDVSRRTWDMHARRMVERGRIRAEIAATVKDSTVYLPRLRDHPWDIIPLVAHYLQGVPEVNFITYNCLDFLLWFDWPENMKTLQRVIAAAAAARGGDTINFFEHIWCYFPPKPPGDIMRECNYSHAGYGAEINTWHKQLDDSCVPFVAYGWSRIAQEFHCSEITHYLCEKTFFPGGSRKIMREQTAPSTVWRPVELGCEPPFERHELMRRIELSKPNSEYSSRLLSIEWLAYQNMEDVEASSTRLGSFESAEKLLFDVRKIRKCHRSIIQEYQSDNNKTLIGEKPVGIKIYPRIEGKSIENLKIIFINQDTIQLGVDGGSMEIRDFVEAGFANRKGSRRGTIRSQPQVLWEFFWKFARLGGEIPCSKIALQRILRDVQGRDQDGAEVETGNIIDYSLPDDQSLDYEHLDLVDTIRRNGRGFSGVPGTIDDDLAKQRQLAARSREASIAALQPMNEALRLMGAKVLMDLPNYIAKLRKKLAEIFPYFPEFIVCEDYHKNEKWHDLPNWMKTEHRKYKTKCYRTKFELTTTGR